MHLRTSSDDQTHTTNINLIINFQLLTSNTNLNVKLMLDQHQTSHSTSQLSSLAMQERASHMEGQMANTVSSCSSLPGIHDTLHH